MDNANGNQQPEKPENKPFNLGQFSDSLVAHILNLTNGDMCIAVSVANLVKERLDVEYRFLMEQSLKARFETIKFAGQHEDHTTKQ